MIEMDIGNYRGSLYIKEDNDVFYWAIECDFEYPESWDWKEIPKYLYDSMAKFNNTIPMENRG